MRCSTRLWSNPSIERTSQRPLRVLCDVRSCQTLDPMNSAERIVPTLASPWRAAVAVVFQVRSYVRLGLAHELAVNLKARDLAAAYERGEFPAQGWQAEAQQRIYEQATLVRSGLLASLGITIAFLAVGLAIAALAGTISVALPVAPGKVLGIVGGGLAAWATLFQLGGYSETYSGEAVHEIVRPTLFKCMFLPGIAIAAAGQVW